MNESQPTAQPVVMEAESGDPTKSPTGNVDRKQLSEIQYGAVIHFTTHYVNPQLLRPWKMGDPHTCTGTGFYIGDKRVITNSHVVHNHTSIRLERHGQPGNFAGRLLCESEVCDLALLTVDDEDFWTGLPPVRMQDQVPELDDTVLAVGYPLGSLTVTVTRGVVSAVKMMDLSLTRCSPEQLAVQIDAAINPGNSGGPVFNNNTKEVVGVAFSSNTKTAEGTGFIIPVPVISLFLRHFEDTGSSQFGLLPELGVRYSALYNQALRKHCFGSELKSPDDRNGILVTASDHQGCAYPEVQVDDILLSIDGQPISEKGDVKFREQERLPWTYLVTRKPCGESLKAEVLRREGDSVKRLVKDLKLAALPKLLPTFAGIDYFPSYVVCGGLVFLPCGRPLGDKAREQKVHSIGNLHWFLEKQGKLETIGDQVCVLGDVLAHPINVSYDLRGERLLAVDSIPVRNMRHLAQQLQPSRLETLEKVELDFGLELGRTDRRSFVVFECKELLETSAEILKLNKIPTWCSPELLDSEECEPC